VDEGTSVLLDMALCGVEHELPAALERCDALGADSASFPPLARATYHLDGLLGYGVARRVPIAELRALAERLFGRAALQLPSAAICGDEDAHDVDAALKSLSELVRRGSPVATDARLFWRSVVAVAEMPASHAALRGLALVLLELDGRLPAGELADRIRYWLSLATTPVDNANLVAGLFSLQRGVLLRNRGLIGSITEFLADLEVDELTPLLPVLRRSLGRLSRPERAYLTDTLSALLGLDGRQAGWALAAANVDRALLGELDAKVAATLSLWKERYGVD
jgi:hypothetical protein